MFIWFSHVEGHFQPPGAAISAQSSGFPWRLLFAVSISFPSLSFAFITSGMDTSASAFNQEGDVTPAEVERAADEYYWYVDSLALYRGTPLDDYDIPGRCYFESLVEQIDDGLLLAERLSDILLKKDEDEQRAVHGLESAPSYRPDSTIQRNTLKLTGTMPRCREELRERYALMGNAWEMIRLRTPSRPLPRDFTPAIFNETLLGFLFGDKVYKYRVNFSASSSAPPTSPFFLHFEYTVREKVFMNVREYHLSVAQAIRATITDQVFYQRDYLQPMSVSINVMHGGPGRTLSFTSSAVPTTSTTANDSTIASQLSNLITLMTQMVDGRKTAQRGRIDGNSRPTKAARKGGKGGGRGEQQQEESGASGSNAGEIQNGLPFHKMMRSAKLRKRMVLDGPDGKICYKHQKVRCDKEGCLFVHNCAMCGAEGMGFDWCTCPRQQR